VDVSYPETCLPYSRLTRSIQLTLSLLRNKVEAHLKGTILLRLIVSDLTLNAYSLHRPIWTCHHLLFTGDLTPGTPLNCVYRLRITVEHFVLLHWKHMFFLPKCFESVPASTHWVSSLRHHNFMCRCGSSRTATANMGIFAWSVCNGHRFNAITLTRPVNLSVGGRFPQHAYHRCTALGDK
jgi:hypothetical protein